MKVTKQLVYDLLNYYYRRYFDNTHPFYYHYTHMLWNTDKFVARGVKKLWFDRYKEYELATIEAITNDGEVTELKFGCFGMPTYHKCISQDLARVLPDLKFTFNYHANEPMKVI